MNMEAISDELTLRLVQYCSIETGSDPKKAKAGIIPSSPRQQVLADLLENQVQEMGYHVDHFAGGIIARAKSNSSRDIDPILINSHLDTSPDAPTDRDHVNVLIHKNYDGSDIHLENGVVISPSQFADLGECIGDTIFTSDGHTLLGADDKGGVAAAMTLLNYLKHNPDIEHGDIDVVFTFDEETGLYGAMKLDTQKDTNAKFGIVLDNAPKKVGANCFNAYSAFVNLEKVDLTSPVEGMKATIKLNGVYVHPAVAKEEGMIVAYKNFPAVVELLSQQSIPITHVKSDHSGEVEFEVVLEDGKSLSELDTIVDERFAKRTDDPKVPISYSISDSVTTATASYDLTHLAEVVSGVPVEIYAENRELSEGYILPLSIKHEDGKSRARFLLRDFEMSAEQTGDYAGMEAKIALMHSLIGAEADIVHEYNNCGDVLAKTPYVQEVVLKALENAGVEAAIHPTRGGDESTAYTLNPKRAIPCLNVPSEGGGCHSPQEWVSLRYVEDSFKTALEFVKLVAKADYKQ